MKDNNHLQCNSYLPRIAVLLLSVCAATAVYGQEDALASKRTIEEIVVTAEKRETSVQETPIAISVFEQKDLDRNGVSAISDLSNEVPSLTVATQQGAVWINLRGVGNENPTPGGDNGVAIHHDGVYIGRATAAVMDVWDLQRMEVLRGPQGTLNGRNSTGGSINLITNKPTNEFDLFGDVQVGNYDSIRFRGVANLPILNEKLAARISVVSSDHNGYQKNLFAKGNDGDDADTRSIRAQLLSTISDSTTFNLSVQKATTRGSGFHPKRRGYPPVRLTALPPPTFTDLFAPALPQPSDPREVRKDAVETTEIDVLGITGTFTVENPKFTFKSISSYYEIDWFQNEDHDGSEVPLSILRNGDDADQLYQEFQLVSSSESSWDWVLGVVYYEEEAKRLVTFDDVVLDPNGGFLISGSVETKSMALYGQSTFNVSDRVRLTAGLRYSDDEKDGKDLILSIPFVFVNQMGEPSDSWSELTGKLGVDWFATDSNMLYATLSRGYKSGAINLAAPLSAPVKPEIANSFEIGSKNRMADDRVQVNISAFFNEFDDLQVVRFENAAVLENAAEATVWGVEVDWQALPSERLTLGGSFGYLFAEFDKFTSIDSALPPPQQVLEDLSGNRLPRTPEYSVNFDVSYDVPLKSGANVIFRVDSAYRSETFYRSFNKEISKESSYTKTDFRIVYQHSSKKWELEAYVENLEDEDVRTNIFLTTSLFGAQNPYDYYASPLTYGVRLSAGF